MSEAFASADMMSAMYSMPNGTSLKAAANALLADAGTAAESFGSIMGAMMAPAASVDAATPADELVSLTDGLIPQMTDTDIISSLLSPDSTFSPELAMALIKGMDAFAADPENSSDTVADLFLNVPVKEKTELRDLLAMVMNKPEISDEETDEEIPSPTQMLTDLLRAAVRNIRSKRENKSAADDTIVSEAAAAMLMPSSITIRIAAAPEENVTVQAVGNDAPAEAEILPEAIEAAETVAQDSAEEFSKALADILDEQITVETSEQEASDPVSSMFEGSRQAVMSRINRPLEEAVADDAAAEATANTEAAVITADDAALVNEAVPTVSPEDTQSIAVHIAERIELIDRLSEGSSNAGDITINLAPKELGDLKIRIRSTSQGLVISFAAQREQAAQIIGDRASALAEALASRGADIREISVTRQISSAESSSDNALDYMGREGADTQQSSGERRFTFRSGTRSGESTENAESDSIEEISEIYYNREAKLWVSA